MLGCFIAEIAFDFCIDCIDLRRHAGGERAAAGGERYEYAALIMLEPAAADQADFFHARENAGQTRTRELAQLTDLPRFECAHVGQHPDNPPLLLGEAVRVQKRTKTADDAFPRLQHEKRQIAVFELRTLS